MYGMELTEFQELAKDAKACYKVGQMVLVKPGIIDGYLETFKAYFFRCFKDDL